MNVDTAIKNDELKVKGHVKMKEDDFRFSYAKKLLALPNKKFIPLA